MDWLRALRVKKRTQVVVHVNSHFDVTQIWLG